MNQPKVKTLVLDAGPLLSLSPLRGLSESYYTVPQVLGELKDEKARTHFKNLGLSAGVKVEVRVPDAEAVAKVTLAAKKSGDFAVLSVADLHVIALTYALHQEHAKRKAAEGEKSEGIITDAVAEPIPQEEQTPVESKKEKAEEEAQDEQDLDRLAEEFERLPLDSNDPLPPTTEAPTDSPDEAEEQPVDETLYSDPSSEDDGQGEWITPTNVALHKSRALDLLPDAAKSKSKKKAEEKVDVGCMSADYAVQNVLMHLGLNLVGVEGTRIESVKSWVLRCHACFKICKDSSKKFCPTCGNATLLRTSISTTASSDPSKPPKVQVHLKPNFQYRTRGTQYSIPLPKPGTSKTGSGTGLILREDQREWMRAVEKEGRKEEREHEKLMKAVQQGVSGSGSVKVGEWNDPDWVPGMLMGAMGERGGGGLPTVGVGRKNPNERRRRK